MHEFLTPEGHKKLQDELTHLREIVLPEIRDRLAAANEDGDLPENNPWLTAKEELEATRLRIDEIRKILFDTPIIKKKKHSRIALGDTVKIILGGQERIIHLTSTFEADPTQNKVSIDSPLGKALLHRKPGESFSFHTPTGMVNITVLSRRSL